MKNIGEQSYSSRLQDGTNKYTWCASMHSVYNFHRDKKLQKRELLGYCPICSEALLQPTLLI